MSNQTYSFRYLANEDEAQHIGVDFTVYSSEHVSVKYRYLHPEYEGARVLMPTVKARLLYSKLLHDPDYQLMRTR